MMQRRRAPEPHDRFAPLWLTARWLGALWVLAFALSFVVPGLLPAGADGVVTPEERLRALAIGRAVCIVIALACAAATLLAARGHGGRRPALGYVPVLGELLLVVFVLVLEFAGR